MKTLIHILGVLVAGLMVWQSPNWAIAQTVEPGALILSPPAAALSPAPVVRPPIKPQKRVARKKPVLPPNSQLMDRAFVSAQWAMSTAASTALAKTAARFAAGDGEMSITIRTRQDIVEAISAIDRRISQALGSNTATDAVRVHDLRAEIDKKTKELKILDGLIAKRFPRYAALSQALPASIREVQASLKTNEAMVVILAADEASYVWALTPKQARWHRVVIARSDVDTRVKKLRADLGGAPGDGARGAASAFGEEAATPRKEGFDRATAYSLYKDFLAPVADLLGPRKTIYFVTSGAWTSLPPALLVTKPPAGDDADMDALRATSWFVRDHAVAILPSVSSLSMLRRFAIAGSQNAPRRPFAGFGAPILGGSDASARGTAIGSLTRGGNLADVESVRQLASLPQTEGELRRLASALGAPADAVIAGAAATEARVRNARLADVRVLAFATHGLVAGEISGLAEPALVFTPPLKASEEDDGLLTASEAAGLNLNADWVILSACNTASGDGAPGAEALSGLARSFFYAGARALLVSHWPVDDEAASLLTTGTLSRSGAVSNAGRAEALRQSMLELMDNKSTPRMAHPIMWAPFVVVGEGG